MMPIRRGLANRSDQVGRNFMNHNLSAVIGFDPRFRNDSVYQKTFGFNDFYLSDGNGGAPLGNVQLLGRISGPVLKSDLKLVPEWVLDRFCAHTVDFLAMSEDVPKPESRVRSRWDKIILQWIRSNWPAHQKLVAQIKSGAARGRFSAGSSKAFDRKTPSHQCGTVRMGDRSGVRRRSTSICRAFEHPNLFVVDAAFLPTSAAVNPALTIAAQALRVADHIVSKELAPMKPVALVTGARRGIGLGIAKALAAKGFDLAITDIVRDDASHTAIEALEETGRKDVVHPIGHR